MTDAEIKTEIRDYGFPTCLEDTDIDGAIRWVIRQIRDRYPVMAVGYFNLVACQQIYDLFNTVPDVATSQGVFPGGLRVYELLMPGGGFGASSDAVFGIAPYLQSGGGFLAPFSFGRFSFNTPGDWFIWDADWAAIAHRFNPGAFEQLTDLDGSPLRVLSVPNSACPAFLRFTRNRTEAEIRRENESAFLTLVEARCSDTVSNKFYLGAGVSFGELIRDDGRTAAHYEKEAQRKYLEGWEQFEALRNDQISPAQRSHGP